MPRLWRPTHGGNSRPPRRSRHPPRAGPSMGGVISHPATVSVRHPSAPALTGVAGHHPHPVCRYITRPDLGHKRVSRTRAGEVVLQLKTPYRDGTTHLVMAPLEFLQRLAALVPRPRLHLIRFHGVLAPNRHTALPDRPRRAGLRNRLLSRSRRLKSLNAGPPDLGSVAQTRVPDRHDNLFLLWGPCHTHRRHRRPRGDRQDSRSFRLAHQSPTSCAGAGPPSLSDGLSPPETRFHPRRYGSPAEPTLPLGLHPPQILRCVAILGNSLCAKCVQGPGKPFSQPVSHHVESATGLIDIPGSLRYFSDGPD